MGVKSALRLQDTVKWGRRLPIGYPLFLSAVSDRYGKAHAASAAARVERGAAKAAADVVYQPEPRRRALAKAQRLIRDWRVDGRLVSCFGKDARKGF